MTLGNVYIISDGTGETASTMTRDGKEVRDLEKADIVLVGISRTSKMPLSIFLSHKGWKIANIPLILSMPLPHELSIIDQKKL